MRLDFLVESNLGSARRVKSTQGICKTLRGKLLTKNETYYLVGALRDGSISTQFQIKVKQKSREWLEQVIVPIFNKVFDLNLTSKAIYIQQDKYLSYYLLFKNKRVWNLIKEKFEMSRNQEFWNTPSFVKNAPKDKLKYYIQGFVDAEGGTPKKVIAGSKIYLHITQKNIETLEFLKQALKQFGIRTGRVCLCDPNSMCFRIWITNKQGILDYIEKIGTQHPDKKERFTKIKNYLLKVQ